MIVIRPCRFEECPAVLALWERAGAIPSPTDTLEELRRLVQTHGDGFLVAIQQGAIVGSVIGGWDGWRGNIYRLAVAPEHRRKGVARRLIVEISAALLDKGAEILSALVEHEHRWAIDFWESLRDLGYNHDPRFARYIARREGGSA